MFGPAASGTLGIGIGATLGVVLEGSISQEGDEPGKFAVNV